MVRKTLTIGLAVALLAVTVAAATAASAKPGQSRMTICHDPPGNPDGGKTMDIPQSAWNAHRDHGDHEGACTAAERARPPAPRPEAPKTPLSLAAKGDGDLDGDAAFRVTIRNPGKEAPLGVALDGTLVGEGRWSVDGDGGRCAIDPQQALHCAFGDLPAGQSLAFRIRFDGPVSLCREVTAVLALSATNDASAGDDRVRVSADAGACVPPS